MRPPIAEQLRPKLLSDILGQPHLVGEKGFLTHLIQQKRATSLLLWGPPGTGKTSIAKIYAQSFDMDFKAISAIFSGVSNLKQIFDEIKQRPLFTRGFCLFVDEIHRFNKSQQDAFLPFVENGLVTLIGATTENPSFHLNNALLSRMQVVCVNSLDTEALNTLFERFEKNLHPLNLTKEAKKLLIELAQGDGRSLLNMVETMPNWVSTKEDLNEWKQENRPLFDRNSDFHYGLISALHKSIRTSDPDGSLYWLSRLLEAGEDPLFITRRLIRTASEDIGLADPEALNQTLSAQKAYQTLGSPEGELAIAQAVIYLALAPKSNALYTAFKKAKRSAQKTGHLSPPKHLLNAPTKMMQKMGFGKEYQYDHDTKEGVANQRTFPDKMEEEEFYTPFLRGFEREMKKRVDYFKKVKNSFPS